MSVKFIDLCQRQFKEEYTEKTAKNNSKKVIKVKTRSGWRSIDSPYNPVGEARSAIGQMREPESRAIVLGSGSGYIASELLKQSLSDIILITGSRVLAERNIKTFSRYNTSKINVTVLVASRVDDLLISHIKPFLENTAELKVIFHPRETKAYPSLFNPLSIYIDSCMVPVSRQPVKPPKRVLFPCSGQLFEPEINRELTIRGIDVVQVESYANKSINHAKAWDLIREHKPDLVLSTNNKGSDTGGLIPEACRQAEVPWATWFLDEPRFIVSKGEVVERQKRFGFCWDIAGIDACRELGFAKIELLPLATNPSHFTPGEGDESLNGRIVYVGSPSFGNEERYFACIKDDPQASFIAKAFEKKLWQERRLPSHEEIGDVIHALGVKNHFSGETLRRLPAFILYKVNLSYRIEALKALADLNPVVYGDGWQGLLPEGVELRDYVDYYRDLVKIYRSDAVHLSLTHLQMRFYPNQRIFDVGACGRIVLGDKLKGWKDLFGSEFEDLIFHDFEELREKAGLLANNKNKRKHLGESLRRLILQRHTFSHRIDKMFEVIYKE